MSDTTLTKTPAGPAVDLRHLDGTIANLDGAARAVAEMKAALNEARDQAAASPDDPEARRAVRMAGLQVRATASRLALDFDALARDGAP